MFTEIPLSTLTTVSLYELRVVIMRGYRFGNYERNGAIMKALADIDAEVARQTERKAANLPY